MCSLCITTDTKAGDIRPDGADVGTYRLKDDSKSLRSCTVKKKKTGCFNHRVVTLVTWLHTLVLEATCINNLRGLILPLALSRMRKRGGNNKEAGGLMQLGQGEGWYTLFAHAHKYPQFVCVCHAENGE